MVHKMFIVWNSLYKRRKNIEDCHMTISMVIQQENAIVYAAICD